MFNTALKLLRPNIQTDPEAEAWHRQYRRTPDLWFLNQHARQNIFIADDFKTGKPKHKLLEGLLPFHPQCYTLHEYTVYNKDLGTHSFPLPFEKGVDFEIHGWYKPELARIQGEIYSIPSSFLWKVLDIEKENGLQFIRKRVLITLPWREVTGQTVPTISKDYVRSTDAWMYVARPEYWDDYIGVALGTRAVPIYTPISPRTWIDQYYKF